MEGWREDAAAVATAEGRAVAVELLIWDGLLVGLLVGLLLAEEVWRADEEVDEGEVEDGEVEGDEVEEAGLEEDELAGGVLVCVTAEGVTGGAWLVMLTCTVGVATVEAWIITLVELVAGTGDTVTELVKVVAPMVLATSDCAGEALQKSMNWANSGCTYAVSETLVVSPLAATQLVQLVRSFSKAEPEEQRADVRPSR